MGTWRRRVSLKESLCFANNNILWELFYMMLCKSRAESLLVSYAIIAALFAFT